MIRVTFIPAFALILISAGEPPQSALGNEAFTTPQERWQTLDEAMDDAARENPEDARLSEPAECTDTITEAREATGQPPLLQREPASPDKPLAIYAVDRRQDGCSVLVMMGDHEDIRPLPLPAEGAVRVMPAEDR